MHTFLGHILLGEYHGEFLGAVVAVVEENHHVALLDGAVDTGIVDGLYKFIGDTFVVTLLHGSHHIGSLLALAIDEQVICHLDALPALVAVHGIVATDD